jgi:hypothetical protein
MINARGSLFLQTNESGMSNVPSNTPEGILSNIISSWLWAFKRLLKAHK